jgi:hypothetical protein
MQMRAKPSRIFSSSELILVLCESTDDWGPAGLAHMALLNKKCLKPFISRLWREHASIINLCEVIGKVTYHHDSLSRPRRTNEDPVVYAVGLTFKQNRRPRWWRYASLFTHISLEPIRRRGAYCIIAESLLEEIAAIHPKHHPFPSVAELTVEKEIKRDGRLFTTREYLLGFPWRRMVLIVKHQLRSLSIHLDPADVASFLTHIVEVPYIKHLEIKGKLHYQPQNEDTCTKRNEFAASSVGKLRHLQSFACTRDWVSQELLRSLREISSLKDLRLGKEADPADTGNAIMSVLGCRTARDPELFSQLISVSLRLSLAQASRALPLFGNELIRLELQVPAIKSAEEGADQSRNKSLLRCISMLPKLQVLNLTYDGGSFGNPGGDLILPLEWDAIQHLGALLMLKELHLKYPILIDIAWGDAFLLFTKWKNMRSLELIDGIKSCPSKSNTLSIDCLPKLLHCMPLLEHLAMGFSDEHCGITEHTAQIGGEKIGRALRSVDLRYTFHGLRSISSLAAIFLASFLHEDTVIQGAERHFTPKQLVTRASLMYISMH